MIILIFICIGLIIGLFSGLLGIGGGLISVPTLSCVFSMQHVPFALRMHLAVGTSLAAIIFTSLVSMRAFHYQGSIVWALWKKLLPGIILGTLTGVLISSFLTSKWLRILFGLLVLYTAIRLLWTSKTELKTETQHKTLLNKLYFLMPTSFITGMTAGILGVGGSVVIIPLLLYGGLPIRQASGTSVACAIPIAFIGACGFMVTGWHIPNLPTYPTGYVNWPAALPFSSLVYSA